MTVSWPLPSASATTSSSTLLTGVTPNQLLGRQNQNIQITNLSGYFGFVSFSRSHGLVPMHCSVSIRWNGYCGGQRCSLQMLITWNRPNSDLYRVVNWLLKNHKNSLFVWKFHSTFANWYGLFKRTFKVTCFGECWRVWLRCARRHCETSRKSWQSAETRGGLVWLSKNKKI